MPRHHTRSRAALALLLALAGAPAVSAQLRVVNWNVTNYSGGRYAEFQTSIYGEFEGRAMAPDVLIGQEFLTTNAVAEFVNLLNTAPGSPGDWAAAPFLNGPDTDSAFFYRTSKVQFLGMTLVAPGGPSPNHPRNIQRYDIRPVGYAGEGATLACYSSHMKAQDSGGDDDARRLLEAERIRDDAAALPEAWHFVLGGDFNIQTSSEPAYRELVGAQNGTDGQLFDPIRSPGSWYNSSSFRFIHTQDPAGGGGMDDRHDQLLLSAGMVDGEGLSYVGDPGVAYSTTTWNDANHSYRAWGNDGTSFNLGLRVEGNTMVGPAIALALKQAASTGGHLPVFLDLRVPPEVASVASIDFGQVPMNSAAGATLEVSNGGDVALWTAEGIADLRYTLSASAPFTAPVGEFAASAGGAANAHTITLDTSAAGPVSGTVTIVSNAPDEPARVVTLTAVVVGGCPADFDGSGTLTLADFVAFRNAYVAGDLAADFDGSGTLTLADFVAFRNAYVAGCP